jgi:hypothetical protein
MDPYFEQLIEYVLEMLPDDQRLRVKAHLDSGCKVCNDEVRTLQDSFHLLTDSLPVSNLSPTLKSRLNDLINHDTPPPKFRDSL